MESYELYITPILINPINGQFRKGHIPFNKGIPMKEWMDGRKIKKVMKFLELGRNNYKLPGLNRIPVISIKDGKLTFFRSATEAAKILKAKGIKINARNINGVCHQKKVKVGKYSYIRKKAGSYQWFFADEFEKYKDLIIK